MNSIQTLASIVAGSGLLIFLLAIPLILRRIPPNELYGIRTRASFNSEADWYRINHIGGRYLAVSGMVILLTGIVGFFLPVSSKDPYSIVSAVITLLVVILPCLRLCSLKASSDSEDDTGKS